MLDVLSEIYCNQRNSVNAADRTDATTFFYH